MRKNVRAKQAIARYAAQLVDDGETILVGSGSTTLEFVCFARPTEVDVVIMEHDPGGVVAQATKTPDGHIQVVETGL